MELAWQLAGCQAFLKTFKSQVMKTVQIDIYLARELYPTAQGKLKKILEDQFGEVQLSVNLLSVIKSLGAALSYKGLELKDILTQVPPARKHQEKNIHGADKCAFVIDVLNDGWQADFTNPEQQKWRPWMEYRSGLGLSFSASCYAGRVTIVAPRHFYLKDEETSDHFGKHFKDIIEEALLP